MILCQVFYNIKQQVHIYTAVKDVFFQKAYEYEVVSSLRHLWEYNIEGEIPTIIMILETDPNTSENDQIDLDMLYQSDIIDYINRS